VIINLGLNAKDAMIGGEGVLTIAARPDRPLRVRLLSVRPKPTTVSITVRDTGTGMTPEVKARIFEPFYTTKERGHGTGLGLAVIHGIVQDHAGTIAVESSPGMGSTFTVLLPLTERPAITIEARPAPGETNPNSELHRTFPGYGSSAVDHAVRCPPSRRTARGPSTPKRARWHPRRHLPAPVQAGSP